MAEYGSVEDPFIIKVNHGGITNADLELAIQIAETQELPGASHCPVQVRNDVFRCGCFYFLGEVEGCLHIWVRSSYFLG